MDDGKRQTLEALEKVAESYRSHPEYGHAIRHFETVLQMIHDEKLGKPWGSAPPSDAIRWQLEENGTWTEVGKLATRLHLKGVESKATLNRRVQNEPRRRQLSNFERLKRAIMAEVRNGKLAAYIAKDDIVFVGLPVWHIPPGSRKYEQRWTKGIGKRRKLH